MQKEKLIIIVTVLIDVIGIGVIIPVLPSYVESLGGTPFTVAAIFSAFSLCAFFSAPILGVLSDKIGRRPILILSLLSTAIGWFIFAEANAIWLLFLGHMIDGLAAGNFSTAQSYLSDIARSEKERTSNLGIIGAVFGIGFTVGPAIGGVLSSYSMTLPFYVVSILALLNTIGAYFFLPETNEFAKSYKRGSVSFNPFIPLVKAIKDINLRSRYIVWFIFNLVIATHQSIFALYVGDVFGFNISQIGYFMAITGVFMAINQGLLLKRFWLKRFTEASLEVWIFLVFAFGCFMYSIQLFPIFLIGFIPMILGQSLIRVVISSRVAGISGKDKRGEAFGVLSSVQSIAMVVGPLAAGLLYTKTSWAPFFFGGILLLIAFCIIKKYGGKFKEPSHDEVVIVEGI